MAVSTIIYDKTGVGHTIDALYSELPYFFKLIHGETTLPISEPIGFDSVEFVARRDKDWHGFNYENTSAEYNLKFDCTKGGELIKDVYEEFGNDGEIYLQYGVTYDSEEIIEFEYKINLNTYTFFGDKNIVQCQVETKSLHELIRSRWDTKLNLFDTKTLDNTTVTAINTLQLPLLSKEISQEYQNVVSTSIEADLQFIDLENRNAYVIFESNNPTKDEISIIPKYNFGIFEGLEGDPLSLQTYFLKATNEGKYKFTINHQFQFLANITRHVTGTTVSITSWSLKVWFIIVRADGSASTSLDFYNQSGTSSGTSVNRTVSVTQETSYLDLKVGDKVFYYCHFGFTASTPLTDKVNTHVTVTNIFQSISVDALTKAKTTFGKSVFLGDAVKKAFQFVTNKTTPVKTSFYSFADEVQPLDGCGANYVLTNGFQIRNFDSANKPIRISLGEIMNSLKAIHCIGMSYEFDGSNDVVKIERAVDFYKDVEIIKIDNTENYTETVAREYIFNQAEIGYKKYLDEGSSGLDDFCTKHEYQTPIKSQANKYSAVSDLIASGEVIETIRREQFNEKPKESTTYDDNVFIISTIPFTPISLTCSFFVNEIYDEVSETTTITYEIVFTQNYDFLRVGNLFTVTESEDNNKTFTILQVDEIVGGETHVIVEESTVNELDVTVTINFPNSTAQPENTESINIISGSDATEFYNLRISPKRMLLNHAPFINSGLRYKSGSDFLKLTDIKGNGLLTSQFDTSASCILGDSSKSVLTENANIFLANFDQNSKVFSPEYVDFETTLTREQIRFINNALRGRNDSETNYGYISVKDREGNYQKVYVLEMKFNPIKCKVKFHTVKKKP